MNELDSREHARCKFTGDVSAVRRTITFSQDATNLGSGRLAQDGQEEKHQRTLSIFL